MNRKKYRRLLLVIFAVYLCAFLYYLSDTGHTLMAEETLATASMDGEKVTSNQIHSKDMKVMPLGMPVGIYVRTKGVMVLGTGSVTRYDGEQVEPAKDVLESGDYILEVNGEMIQSIDWFVETINKSAGEDLTLLVLRDDKENEVQMTPVQTEDSRYKLGVWVRQDAQGIGTLSFVDENNHFAALGHGIADVDTSEIIDIRSGRLYESTILSIVKGECGVPGEMIGNIDYQHGQILGRIESNNEKGIYGTISKEIIIYDESQALPVGYSYEIEKGPASVRCCVDGEVKDYQIEIEGIQTDVFADNRDLTIQITDQALLNMTNGIIQGMSGSPIIQNGKIIGVVTHVLVDDPAKGYGIFVENMLNMEP